MRGRTGHGIFAALLAWPAIAFAAPATPALIAEVQTALDRGDALHATNLAEEAMKQRGISPTERARLLFYHGQAEELLGIPDAATRDFTAALNGSALPREERAEALLQRGFLRDGEGKLNEAASDYSAVIALGGEGAATALNNRANIYRRQKRFSDAKHDYGAALSAGGKAQYIWYGLGQIAEAQADVLAARGFYAKSVAVDPAYALASQRLAALGGPPEGAIANQSAPISLKAPAETEATPLANAPITLRPPRPKSAVLATPAPSARQDRTAQAPSITLRPSIDQSASAKGEVQLGAWRSEAEAMAGWEKAVTRAQDLLGSVKPHVVAADLPGRGRYYRLRAAPGPGLNRTQFCDTLTAKGLACFPVRD